MDQPQRRGRERQFFPAVLLPFRRIVSRVERDEIRREVFLGERGTEEHRLQPAFRAVRLIEIQDRDPTLRWDTDRPAVGAGSSQHRRFLPQQRRTVELRINAGVHQVYLIGKVCFPRCKPGIRQVDGHPFVSHQGRIDVMVIDPDGDMVPDRVGRAAADQIVGFRILDGHRFGLKTGEEFLQLGIKGSQLQGIRGLRPSGQGQEQHGRYEQQPTHRGRAG